MLKFVCLLGVNIFLFQGGAWGEMTLEEKIGQLLVIPACPLRQDARHLEGVEQALTRYHAGGVILKQGEIASQRALIEKINGTSENNILYFMDAELGLSQRLSDGVVFPQNLTLGAIQNKELLYRLGYEIGRECRAVGAHVNLAPVADVNCNPDNPIIRHRSFGEDPAEVGERAFLMMRGMQDAGILACAKHFPGHGDTSVDSHLSLPILPHSLERLEAVELFAFKKSIEGGVACMMPGHLQALALDPLLPATLSPKIIGELLKGRLHFQGLVVTDALNMKGLVSHFSVEEIAVLAFLAGNDLLLYGDHIAPHIDEILESDLPRAFEALKRACETGVIELEELDRRVRRILSVKEALAALPPPDSVESLHSPEVLALKRELYREAITLVKNEEALIPLNGRTSVTLARSGKAPFFEEKLRERLSFGEEGVVIVPIVEGSLEEQECVETLASAGKTLILVLFTTPYSLTLFPESAVVIVAYEADEEAQRAAADLILGELEAHGKLPVKMDLVSGSPL